MYVITRVDTYKFQLHANKLETHLTLLPLSRQAPHTMPSMSRTPRAPATKPPRRRPTAVALLQSLHTGWTVLASTAVMLESLLTAGLLQSHSDSTPGRMADTMYTGLRCHYCCIPMQHLKPEMHTI